MKRSLTLLRSSAKQLHQIHPTSRIGLASLAATAGRRSLATVADAPKSLLDGIAADTLSGSEGRRGYKKQ